MRLDKALLARGLVTSRSRAQELIRDGFVSIDGVISCKPASIIGADCAIRISEDAPVWVSRAALKLVKGLKVFRIDPNGCVALDVGASTGGFTEVLLAQGAARVFALDVGHGQLHPTLQNDPHVVNMEGTNAKDLSTDALPPLDIIVSDVSFISLTKALPKPLGFAKPGARANVGKGGIVKDQAARDQARADVRDFLDGEGWKVLGETESPIKGSDGNVEYLIGACKGP